ncbi:peptide deformylase [Amylibacter kogurei]|uniref:Peptide deformylase-like n=1 Tax=Paramylibacter kogurei TaxID=1889778 RepID=A0A2G5K123_9RHOB|nr:peptide deformylase [Amylibacter kogurei]PIB23246.1 peptide deformylase [Amylibacter kogurei]
MAIRPFIPYPDKRLRTICDPVETIDDQVHEIWNDMLDSMYAMPGVGLGAPQIGFTKRLAVMDCSEKGNEPVRMANPEILHQSAKLREHTEGSPNLPDVWAKIERPRAVTVTYLDENSEQVERDFVGLWATSVQHQIDHLNGKMYFDHLSSVKRKMLLAKAAKIAKKG